MCLVLLFLLTSFIMISWKWPVVRFHTHIPKAAPPNNSSRISAIDMGISQEEWDRLQKALDWPSPDHEITQLNLSTSPVHTTFSIVRLNDTYNVGDKICVTITARDHNNNLKTYGGDFFQAKLFNSKLKASVYGEVIDHRNGTYTVDLLLPWEGQAQVSVRLVHSCEVVRILKKYRETSFPRSHYYGYFVGPGPKGTRISEKVECNLKWGSRGSWSKGNCCCEYKDVKTETVWQCDRPKQLSCDHWVHHEAGALESPLNSFEMQLFASTLTNVEITGDTKTINVLPNITSIVKTERCRSGLITPVPAGFYFQDVWKSFVCNTQVFSRSQMANCLKNKIFYMLGDSTTRQWFEYLEGKVPGIKRVNLHTPRLGGPLMIADMKNNIIIHWSPHSVPLRFYKMLKTDLHHVSNDIDEIAGGSYGVIVFTFWAHLVFHPLTFYVHEVAKIRQAVLALLMRAPDTTVIIKSGNTGGLKNIFQSDWLAMQLNIVMREMFSDIDGVMYMDVWQMTSCHYLEENIHPGPVIIANEVNMLLSHICPS
ncbi:NXPE family member 3-like isoform X2 [Triplophysa rosa]|nr:NXPE family member 3-like isoform X2 [Triplophysa rosa]